MSAFGAEVAAVLRAQAARKRLSHDAVSQRTGRAISRAQVQRYLTGERSPSVEDLVLLADALGLDGPEVMTKAARAVMGASPGSSPRP